MYMMEERMPKTSGSIAKNKQSPEQKSSEYALREFRKNNYFTVTDFAKFLG